MVSSRFARCLAKLMGDGNVGDKYVRYNNTCDTLIDEFKTDITLLFGKVRFSEGIGNSGTKYVVVSRKYIVEIFKKYHPDYKSENIFVPVCIFDGKKGIKKAFLRSFYDDEGCVGLRVYEKTKEWKRNISLASNSFQMLYDVKKLLLEFFSIGSNRIIENHKGSKKDNSYLLSITGKENIKRFEKEIGFNHPAKKEKIRLMIQSYNATSKNSLKFNRLREKNSVPSPE